MENRIFSTDSAKAIKADSFGWLNGIHYLAPHTQAGLGDVCGNSTPECRALCLGPNSGHAAIIRRGETTNAVLESRKRKTVRFLKDRTRYMKDVVRAIELLQRAAKRHEKQLCVRLNGASDIMWESVKCERNGIQYRNVMEAFPEEQFIDYTKHAKRFDRALPPNYYLTFSRSELNESESLALLARGINVAICFETKPESWNGFPVIDGDKHDLRHLDPRGGYVVALSPKGRVAKSLRGGFVVRN